MRQLLKQNVDFQWSDKCEEELLYLKKALMSKPVLMAMDFNKDVHIFSDASERGYGHVLAQIGSDGRLHPIMYGGRATPSSEKNLFPAEMELIGLALAIKPYDYWLLHRKIYVYTDNSTVLHLKDWKPTTLKQKRLITYLVQFKIYIKYIPGPKNLAADALSRICVDMTDTQRLEFTLVSQSNESDFVFTAQCEDVQGEVGNETATILAEGYQLQEPTAAFSSRAPENYFCRAVESEPEQLSLIHI